jgi:hypothetical protein
MDALINLKQENLEKAVKYFLDCTAKWTPRWFNKPKFHLILHILDHIPNFGPATVFATEAQESYNAIIRAWSIHSNRQSPSHDIANHAAGLARIRHLISGGFYEAEVEQADGSLCKKWITAGPDVVKLGQTPSIITKRLGISFKEGREKGNILTFRNIICPMLTLENRSSNTLQDRSCALVRNKIIKALSKPGSKSQHTLSNMQGYCHCKW